MKPLWKQNSVKTLRVYNHACRAESFLHPLSPRPNRGKKDKKWKREQEVKEEGDCIPKGEGITNVYSSSEE